MDAPGSAPKTQRFLKIAVGLLLTLLLAWPLTFGLIWLTDQAYTSIHPTRFPFSESKIHPVLQSVKSDSTEAEKGAALAQAMTNRLEEELNSTFGWSVNDLWVSPTRWLDNRANRQRGTMFATRMLATFYATHLAKYGTVDAENEWLKEAREKRFAFSEDNWWLPSSESEYRKGLELVAKYEAGLRDGKSVFNMRTDDMYNPRR